MIAAAVLHCVLLVLAMAATTANGQRAAWSTIFGGGGRETKQKKKSVTSFLVGASTAPMTTDGEKKYKDYDNSIGILSAVCLAVFALFANNDSEQEP